jgi:hypothetical protein
VRVAAPAAVTGALLYLAAGASAATMTITVPEDPVLAQPVNWRVEGTTERPSTLFSFVEKDGVDCENNVPKQRARPGVYSLPANFPSAGAFSQAQTFTPPELAPYRVCSYLYYIEDDEETAIPRFIATMTFTPGEGSAVLPGGSELPVPPTLSGAPRQRIGKKKVVVLASCETACRLVSSGRSGRIRVRAKTVSAPAGKQVKLVFKLPAVTVKSMKRTLASGKKVNFKVVCTATFGTGDAVTARRTVRIIR